MSRAVPGLLVLVGLSLGVAGCATNGTPLSEIAWTINNVSQFGATVIVPDDTIVVDFPPDLDEYDQTTRVRPDGKASFAFLDEIVVGGLTIDQLDALLTQRYEQKRDFKALQISVRIDPPAPRHVYVVGEVRNPGRVEYPPRGLTLLEALGAVGGHDKRTALMEDLRLVRWVPPEQRRKMWAIDASLDYWDGTTPLNLLPNDIIFVPNKTIDKVNIWVDQYIRQLIPIPFPVAPFTF